MSGWFVADACSIALARALVSFEGGSVMDMHVGECQHSIVTKTVLAAIARAFAEGWSLYARPPRTRADFADAILY
jgi:hypothetical protein